MEKQLFKKMLFVGFMLSLAVLVHPAAEPNNGQGQNRDQNQNQDVICELNLLLESKNNDLQIVLGDAAEKNMVWAVQPLLDRGAQVNIAEESGETPLIIAAAFGNAQIVKLFLDAGADVNAVDNEGETALARAGNNGHVEIVKILLAAGADVNMVDNKQQSALVRAVNNGHIEMVKLLLDAGVNVHAVDKEDMTALMYAINYRKLKAPNVELAKLLLAAGADPNTYRWGETILMKAACEGHLAIVDLLLAAGADIHAVGNGHPWDNKTALQLARERGHANVVDALVNEGAEHPPFPSLKDLIITAIFTPNSTFTEAAFNTLPSDLQNDILKKFVRKNYGVQKAFFYVAENNILWALRPLTARGAKINNSDCLGRTALMFAARAGHCAIVQQLLADKADVHVVDTYAHETALLHAAKNGHTQVVAQLLGAEADVDGINCDGDTALMLAAKNGYAAIVEILLTAWARTDCNNKKAETALSLATRHDRAEIVEALLACGVQDIGGRALNSARFFGHMVIIQTLIDGYLNQMKKHCAVYKHKPINPKIPQALIECVLPGEIGALISHWLSVQDLAALRCVSTNCLSYSQHEFEKRMELAIKEILIEYIEPALNDAKRFDFNNLPMIDLLQKNLESVKNMSLSAAQVTCPQLSSGRLAAVHMLIDAYFNQLMKKYSVFEQINSRAPQALIERALPREMGELIADRLSVVDLARLRCVSTNCLSYAQHAFEKQRELRLKGSLDKYIESVFADDIKPFASELMADLLLKRLERTKGLSLLASHAVQAQQSGCVRFVQKHAQELSQDSDADIAGPASGGIVAAAQPQIENGVVPGCAVARAQQASQVARRQQAETASEIIARQDREYAASLALDRQRDLERQEALEREQAIERRQQIEATAAQALALAAEQESQASREREKALAEAQEREDAANRPQSIEELRALRLAAFEPGSALKKDGRSDN